MLLFISGKITGDDNFKAKFKQVQDKLIKQGHRVLNPCWIDAEMANLEHSEYLHIDFAMIDIADGIYMLSDWQDSTGAKMEYDYALKSGKEVIFEMEKNCDNCRYFDTYFDCSQCKDFNEWEEKINIEEFKPTKRKFWRLKQLHEEQQQLYQVKNQKYGDSFGVSIEKYGLISALTRMSDKWNRIENLILTGDNGTDDESLKDSLMDLANYCNMTVIELEATDDNRTNL